MPSPQNEGQRCSTDDTVAVQNSPARTEIDISGTSPSTRGDFTGQHSVSSDPARTDCPHRYPQESSMRQPITSAQTDKLGAVLSSSCSSAASAPSAHGTSSRHHQPSEGDLSASVAQTSSVSAGPMPLCTGTTVAQPTEVQAGKTSVGDTSNTSREMSTLEESNSGSSDALTTQTDEGLDRISRSQRAQYTDDPAAISRSPITDERVPQRGLNPNVSASLNVNHSNAIAPRHQQALATTISRASSSQRTDMRPSAQQQARSETSRACPSHAHVPNVSVASITSPFDMLSSNRGFYLGYLAPQYPVDSDAPENLVDPYTQYFHVC